ncbi:MAG: 2OG-Fe(II) oxygenase [Oceanicaulis sp.]
MTADADLRGALQAWSEGDLDRAIAGLETAALNGAEGAWPALLDASSEAGLDQTAAARVRAALETAPKPETGGRLEALLAVSGIGAAPDWSAAIKLRSDAAASGDRRAALELALLCLLAGDENAAIPRLEALAGQGGGEAVAALLRLGADAGVVSETAAGQAAALAQAHPLGGALAQDVAGLPRRKAEPGARAAAVDAEALATTLFKIDGGRRALSDAPRVATVPNAVHPAVCDYIAAAAAPFLKPAEIYDPGTGQTRPDPYRRSLTAALPISAMDLPAMAMRERMARLAGADASRAESLAILVYRPGEEYRAHFDYIAEDQGRASRDLARRGQRAHTVLVKLNHEHEGGETQFPRLDLSWSGKRGEALVFDNLTADGRGDPKTLHAGAPVSQGAKLLASLWIRAGKPV